MFYLLGNTKKVEAAVCDSREELLEEDREAKGGNMTKALVKA